MDIKISYIESKGYNYLSEFMEELPENCIFNKVLTGCGGTTVALKSKSKYVICVPFVSLIENKVKWANENNIEVLPVYGGAAAAEQMCGFEGDKILVTYDSLPKLLECFDVSEWRLLVDEAHKLVDSGSFRYNAVNNVLKLLNEFKSFTLMTATPVKRKYLPKALQNIPIVQVSWENIKPVNIDYTIIEQEYLYKSVAVLASDHISGRYSGNAYIFLNSVKSIIEIIKYLKKIDKVDEYGSLHDFIKIVCSSNDENEMAIRKELGVKFKIDTVSTLQKKVTFLTSTLFEGSDIYDEEGKTYIISDGMKSHTKYDIMTVIPQIIGRIRDAKYKNYAQLVFSPSPYFSYTTLEEFEKDVFKQLEYAEDFVNKYNVESNPKIRKALFESVNTDPYLIIKENEDIEVCETAWCSEMHHYEAIHTTYYVKREPNGKVKQKTGTSRHTLNDVPYNLNSVPDTQVLPDALEKYKLGGRPNFKDIVDIYISNDVSENEKKFILKKYPFIDEALKKLGYEKMKALKFIII